MQLELSPSSLKEDYDKKIVRKFRDMKSSYKNTEKVTGNPIIYVVYIRDFGTFETGLNVMNPGTINKEFFMTKGHRHKKPLPELYVLIKGKSKLLIEGKKQKFLDMKKNKFYHIPGDSGHRLINTGKTPAEVLTIYSKNAGRSYDFKFKKRFFKK